MARTFKLSVSEVDYDTGLSEVPAYRVTLTITDAVGIEPELFVVKAEPTPTEPDRVAWQCVAAAADMTNLSAASPPQDNPAEPYRVSEVELLTDTTGQTEEFIQDVRRRLTQLLKSLAELDTVSQVTEYEFTDQ